MARQRLDQKNIRKIIKVGKQSLSVTLPIEYVRDLKWREKQKVVVTKRGKSLIIKDWHK